MIELRVRSTKLKAGGLVVAALLLAVDANAQGQPVTPSGGAILAGALGPLLGALIAFLSLQLQARFQARREDERWNRAKSEERENWIRDRAISKEVEARLAAAELAKRIAMAANSMTWMLWMAKFDKTRFVPQSVGDHDQYMKGLYSELVAAQVALAAVNQKLYRESLPLVRELYKLDAEIALCATRLPESIEELGEIWLRSKCFEDKVPDVFSDILGEDSSGSMVVDVQNARSRPAPNSADQADG